MRELNNPDHVLEFITKDCSEAISANPLNPKSEHYLALARACQVELNRRQSVRIERKNVQIDLDLLALKMKKPQMVKYWTKFKLFQGFPRTLDRDCQAMGALAVGLRKLHLTKGA